MKPEFIGCRAAYLTFYAILSGSLFVAVGVEAETVVGLARSGKKDDEPDDADDRDEADENPAAGLVYVMKTTPCQGEVGHKNGKAPEPAYNLCARFSEAEDGAHKAYCNADNH